MTSENKACGSISLEFLKQSEDAFYAESKNILAMNALTRSERNNIIVNRREMQAVNHNFSVKLPDMKILDQKSSGRCWIFAALTVMRRAMATKYNLPDEFELSQSYLFFWDKFEKCNYFLENIIATVDEDVGSRLVRHLLTDPICDGGQWDMIVNLVNKYGIVPKAVFPESVSSSGSAHLNRFLLTKLRDFACELRQLHQDGKTDDEIRQAKLQMMKIVYRIMSIHLGVPPLSFEWTVHDKDKKFLCFQNLTPREFYKKHVPDDINNYISIVNDPRHDYSISMTVDKLGNVVEGNSVLYINAAISDLRYYAKKTIDEGKAVWFGCDVAKDFIQKDGVLCDKIVDYEMLYGTVPSMNKKDRLLYNESLMTHAMVFTGYDQREGSDAILKWRVENSWGCERGDKGFDVMSDSWFEKHMYQVVIDKRMLNDEHRAALEKVPIVLPPWDPMGSLA